MPARSAPAHVGAAQVGAGHVGQRRSAPRRSAPTRYAPRRFAPRRSAPRRSAPIRSAPRRSARRRPARPGPARWPSAAAVRPRPGARPRRARAAPRAAGGERRSRRRAPAQLVAQRGRPAGSASASVRYHSSSCSCRMTANTANIAAATRRRAPVPAAEGDLGDPLPAPKQSKTTQPGKPRAAQFGVDAAAEVGAQIGQGARRACPWRSRPRRRRRGRRSTARRSARSRPAARATGPPRRRQPCSAVRHRTPQGVDPVWACATFHSRTVVDCF